jgi:hypothetical protein
MLEAPLSSYSSTPMGRCVIGFPDISLQPRSSIEKWWPSLEERTP